MLIRRKTIIIILISSFIILASLVGAAAILLEKLYGLETYKTEILAEVQKSLNREVRYGQGEFSLAYGPSFTFSQVVIEEKGESQAAPFIKADRMAFRLSLLPLFIKKIVVKEIVIERPLVRIYRNQDGTFNISDLLEGKKERPIQVKALRLRGASLIITDRFVTPQGIVHRLDKMDLSISNLIRGEKTKFSLSAIIMGRTGKSEIKLKGRGKLSAEDHPFFDSVFDAHVVGKNLPAERYWDYYSQYVPFNKIIGYLDVESSFKGKLKEFEAAGKMEIKRLRFDYPGVFHAVLAPRDIQLKYSMALSPRDVTVDDIDINVDGFHARGSCDILDIPSHDPRIVARAVTSPFKLESYFHYIPFGIIPRETSEFIEKNIKAGTCRLDDGRLEGRLSQITSMWENDNARVLLIKSTIIEGGLLRLSDKVPSFNSIKGKLILEGRNFALRDMSGKFGTSSFTMNGAITDYCLKTPSSYPFSMTMVPQKAEVAWLLGEKTGSRLNFFGTSYLRLNGHGFTNDYKLSGDWILRDAAYSHDQHINKPVGKDNRITFAGDVNQEGFHVTSFQYSLPPMALALSAQYNWGEKEKLAIAANSNRFQMETVAQYFPLLMKYQPHGGVQMAVHGEGNTADPLQLNWRGDVSLNGASFVPAENIKTVSNITGIVRLKGDELETPQITAQLGTSTITGKGRVIHFSNPSLNVDFICPNLELTDLGLISSNPEKKVTGIKGNITWGDDSLYINSLSGRLDNSSFQVKGKVTELKRTMLDIQVTSSYLEMEDVLSLAGIRKAGPEKEPGKPLLLKATIAADKVKWKHFQFTELRSDFNLDKQVLAIRKLDFGTLNGKVIAKGRVDYNDKAPKYAMTFAADKLSSEELAKAFDYHERQMTGSLAIEGGLTAQGDTLLDLEKTALGTVKVKASKGMLKQFPGLSKMFSILNVSQLFKFQLPDMVSGGMPYNEINANFNFKEGTVSSNDLFVKSDAMNIVVVGKIDMIREEGDGTVGIQPLQTVDKIVSSIPIVGWIITGKEGTFVTAYFKVQGKLNNPTVTAIPIQSMSSAVFNIFKRTFQLPVKIFTNTGEVFLGK